MANEAKITGIVVVVAVVVIVAFLVYDFPAESSASDDENAFEAVEPYWTQPIDDMKDNVIDNYIPPTPVP